MADYLKQFPGASDIKRCLALAADDLAKQHEACSKDDWQWFENILSYDNAVLCHALYVAAIAASEQKYFDVAEKTCAFLLENTYTDNHFSFVGCDGWYRRGQKRAQFDQQPIEVASTVMMLRAAYEATDNRVFLRLQKKAFDWFLGENDLHTPVYDFKTKGCSDGLEQSGLNLNQGAESMLSFLLSLLCIVESYAGGADLREEKKTLEDESSINRMVQAVIKDIAAKSRTDKPVIKEIR
jgi:uncharacterized protein YyaL (SSP411 family)